MKPVSGSLLLYSGIAGSTAVIAGAFAAHALKNVVTTEDLQVFETAVRYQAYHAIALLALAAFARGTDQKWLLIAGRFFLAGILLFSGSLYFLSCRKLMGMESLGWVGAITPFGGLCFITGWIIIVLAAFRQQSDN
jgi:uncharacterized membrane protein YgdD (TMEM256/DUF423 family)